MGSGYERSPTTWRSWSSASGRAESRRQKYRCSFSSTRGPTAAVEEVADAASGGCDGRFDSVDDHGRRAAADGPLAEVFEHVPVAAVEPGESVCGDDERAVQVAGELLEAGGGVHD